MLEQPVILVHGIRTKAAWYDDIERDLSVRGFDTERHDFGVFRLHRFVFGHTRRERIDAFYDWYVKLRLRKLRAGENASDFRPSVIAHSFGTYIVAHAMRKYPDLRLGRIILCGSILPRDFDWVLPFGRNQVSEVINDYSLKDIWSRLAHLAVRDAGASGAEGFSLRSPLVRQNRFALHGHSDYFRQGHYEQWISFLNEPRTDLRIVRSSSLPNGLDWPKVATRTRGIDKDIYGRLPGHDAVALPAGLSATWLKSNTDIYTLLMDAGNRVHGYVNAMPLVPQAFEDVLAGKLPDNKILPQHIPTYADNTIVDMYLMSIAIHPTSRRFSQGPEQSAFHLLFFGLIQHLINLAEERRIFIRRIGAIAWTDEGKRICELMGMTRMGSDNLDHPVYSLQLTGGGEQPTSHRLMRELRRTYARLGPIAG